VTGPATAGSPLIPEGVRGTLVLVRHGESTFIAEGRFQGRLDPPLSPLGERQAASAAAWLAAAERRADQGFAEPPREIVHSPLRRAVRSAEAIAAAFRAGAAAGGPSRLRPEPALVEIGQGKWEGRTHEEVTARWGRRLAAWRQHPTRSWAPGGERLSAAQRRVRSAVPALLGPLQANGEPAGGSWTVVVAHDGILRLLLLALLDLPLQRFWAFPFALGGATLVDLDGGRATLRAHNLTAHLAGTLGPGSRDPSAPDRDGAL
jgi:probable phosphoglycerate mutase